MTVKKYTALFFLSIASTIMLAFAVLPHHHHHEYICFNAIHCENIPANESHSHGQYPSGDKGNCVNSLFQTKVSRIQSSVHSCEEGHCFHYIYTSFFIADILNSLSLEAENKTYFPLPYREKLHPGLYTSELAGRAPPFKS